MGSALLRVKQPYCMFVPILHQHAMTEEENWPPAAIQVLAWEGILTAGIAEPSRKEIETTVREV
jgi:hypothetical protein